jgi:hypothetical protein
VDLEAQPGGHTAAAVLHIRLVEAHVLVARLGPVQTLRALSGIAEGGGCSSIERSSRERTQEGSQRQGSSRST